MSETVATAEDFPAFVERRFGGKLLSGWHSPDGKACLHEAWNVAGPQPGYADGCAGGAGGKEATNV